MKLFIKPGSCSLASHIVIHEAGLKVQVEKMKDGKTESGADFKTINPKGYVPALELDNGEVLTEGAVILQFLSDKADGSKLLPASGTMERYRAQEWLNYVGTELHKGIGAVFNPGYSDDTKDKMRAALKPKFEYLDNHLAKNDFLMGKGFTAPDAYAFTVLGWTKHLKIDLAPYKNVTAYLGRVGQRQGVQAALKAEGLA
jgi:glutathione S-transferase